MERKDFFAGVFSAQGYHFADIEEISGFAFDEQALLSLDGFSRNLIKSDLDTLKSSNAPLYQDDDAKEIYIKIFKVASVLFGVTDLEALPFFTVNALPSPFDNRPWKAMCVDHHLGASSGVAEGIYFKREFLVPGMLEIMIAHEIMHHFISSCSSHKGQAYTSLFEEGICDFLSYYTVLKVKPELLGAVKAYMLQNRFGARRQTVARNNYYQFSKCVFYIALENGLSSVIDLLKQGRRSLSPSGAISTDAKLSDQTLELLSSLFFEVDSIVILPIDEYAIFKFTAEREITTVPEIATEFGVSLDTIISRTEKMQRDGLLTVDGDKVLNYNKEILNKFYYSI